VLEPPSEKLVATLSDLRLCTAADFRRCRTRVRRLAHDLPAFDSVWIDALVQARKLTSYQARVLESGDPHELRVGPCVLLDRLGTSAAKRSYLARHINGDDRCVIKFLDVGSELYDAVASRISALVKSHDALSHPNIVAPHAFNEISASNPTPHTRRLAVISNYLPALHLAELLIRRGRFPAPVVQSIARHVLNGLVSLEAAGFVHGGVNLKNVRLTTNGLAVLVNAGIGPAASPEFKIDAAVPPEKYFGIAPELIGTGNTATIAADLYALGCLLWHLLAGRAPHSIGDPLALLAAHQTTPIPDVREWAPDTPAELAEAILKLTAQQPQDRARSAREVLEQLGEPRRADRRRLAQFRGMFETTVPRVPTTRHQNRPSRWSVLLVLLFVLTGISLTLIDHGARNHVLNLAARILPSLGGGTPPNEAGPDKSNADPDNQHITSNGDAANAQLTPKSLAKFSPLPTPNAHGIIQLQPGTKYEAAEIAAVGPLTIQRASFPNADAKASRQIPLAEIIITNQPLRIWSAELTLKNIRIRFAKKTRNRKKPRRQPTALLLAETAQLRIHGCRIETETIDEIARREEAPQANSSTQPSSHTIAAIAWKPIDEDGSGTSTISIMNSVFVTDSAAFHFARAPQSVHITNCLKLGTGPFLRYRQPPNAGSPTSLKLNHTILRRAGSLISINTPQQTSTGFIAIEADNCVFDIPPTNGSLVEWNAAAIPENWFETIEIIGGGCFANPDVVVASHAKTRATNRIVLDTTRMQIEGITTAPFDFHGPISDDVRTSEIKSFVGPTTGSQNPGINAKHLP